MSENIKKLNIDSIGFRIKSMLSIIKIKNGKAALTFTAKNRKTRETNLYAHKFSAKILNKKRSRDGKRKNNAGIII